MIEAARSKALSIVKLEAMTSVCSVGLDMIAIPGDTSADVISGIIADEAAIGMVNTKTTAVRLIPAIGKKSVMNSTLVDFSVADLLWKLIQNLLQNSLQEAVEFQLLSRALKTNRLL